jgi:aspartate-semialdehyde dehydrogenase
VPTFVGEGTALVLELERPLGREAVEQVLSQREELTLGDEPSLRDALGVPAILVGRVEADPSGPKDLAYRLWLATDPLRLVADAAMRAAARRLGLA